MRFRRISRMITGLGLSFVLCFGSVSEAFGAGAVFAAGEEEIITETEDDEDTLSVVEEVSDNDAAEKAAVSDNESADEENVPGDDINTDDTVSKNDAEAGEEDAGETEESVSVNETDPSVSENENTGGGSEEEEDPEEQYKYTSPDDDPAYKDNEVWISAIDDSEIVYDGTEHKPHPFVFYDMEMLKEGRDYTLSWKNTVKSYLCDNKEFPSSDDFETGPQIIITMKGSYSGTTMAFYNIYPRDISIGEFVCENTTLIYTGKKLDYTPRLFWKGKELEYKTSFKFDVYDGEKDEYRAFTDAELTGDPNGDVSYMVRIKGKGNFGGFRYTGLEIKHIENAVAVSGLKVSSIPVQQYTGEEITADKLLKKGKAYELVVSYGKTKLVQGVDYNVYMPTPAVYPGKYNVVIEGTKKPGTEGKVFVGEKVVSFTIEGSLKNAQVNGVMASYDAKPADEYVRPDESSVSIVLGGATLSKEYYTISYKKDNKAGTATMTVKGKNGFKGKKSVKYKINGRSIEGLEFYVGAAFYRKKGVKPEVTVVDGSEYLIKNVNYTLSYKNNKKFEGKKAPSVTVKGKGLYTGKKTVEFKIKREEIDFLDGYELTVQDRVYSSKPGAYTPKIVFKDPDGAKLKAGVDYDVVYKSMTDEVLSKDHVAVLGEEIKAVITTKGAYEEDTFTEVYHIIGKGLDISKAEVSVKAQEYKESSSGVRLPVDDSTIKVMLGGKRLPRVSGGNYVNTELSGDVNGFEVITDSYKNNTKAGTASVKIRGVGIYGGIKTIKYTIKSKEVDGIDPSKKYIPRPAKCRDVTEFGAVVNDGKDDTAAIMSAINAISTDDEHEHNLYFPKGRYNICGSGNINIGVPNVNIIMDAEAELYVASQGDGYNVILIHEDNISIRGGKISGERFRHSGGPVGQFGMGITISDGKNITIRDMVICDNRGDGIYINDNGNKTVSNVTIKDCDIYDNSRNNICVIRADYVTIQNCHIHHEKDGHSPMAGIDLEPDMAVGHVKDNKKVRHVVIKDCKIETYQHQGAHINDMGLWAYYGIMIIYGFGEPVVEDVRIEGCEIYGDLSIGSSKGVEIINTVVHGETLPGDC